MKESKIIGILIIIVSLILILDLFSGCTKYQVQPVESIRDYNIIEYQFLGTEKNYLVFYEDENLKLIDTIVSDKLNVKFSHKGKEYFLIKAKSIDSIDSYVNVKILRNGLIIASNSGYYKEITVNNEVDYYKNLN